MRIVVTSIVICLLVFSCKKDEKKTIDQLTPVSNNTLERVEPSHWWVGFKNSSLQLLVKEDSIGLATPSIQYAGISIDSITSGTSVNYFFIDLTIAEHTKAGKFDIVFTDANGKEKRHTYELKDKSNRSDDLEGFDSSDVVYLVTPDRFSNGNSSNDMDTIFREKTIDRQQNYARHGGDIQGIIDHLDYIKEMGFTQIWSSPLLVNDMPEQSYHGYAITDFYKVDPRFGTLKEYIDLSVKAKKLGIGLIMDQVANHCGLYHWWMDDLPFNDWVNYQNEFENNEEPKYSNHRRTSNQDTYASVKDKEGMTKGWFVRAMPDLNQQNPFLATYIIQNSIWWIETLQLAGIRQDTYPYPDKDFMAQWAGAIMNEYPNFSIVGEEWSYNPSLIAYWQDGTHNNDGYDSNLKSTMDFAMQSKLIEAITEEESWSTGLVKIYEGLANDFVYASPKDLMIFTDNHDMSRVFTQLKGDVQNTKMALSYMLTLPRIPQIYYGTEILMNDFENPGDHGLIRTDFPGGWEDDTVNAFTGDGLSDVQKEMQNYLKKLLNFRKKSKAIHDGKTIHFAPFMDTYFLFRKYKDEVVVHIMNKNEKPIKLDLRRYAEIGLEDQTLTNVISGETMIWKDHIELKSKGSFILTTKTN